MAAGDDRGDDGALVGEGGDDAAAGGEGRYISGGDVWDGERGGKTRKRGRGDMAAGDDGGDDGALVGEGGNDAAASGGWCVLEMKVTREVTRWWLRSAGDRNLAGKWEEGGEVCGG
nr:hypothetical protein [Tanacetum cinerariifolium]